MDCVLVVGAVNVDGVVAVSGGGGMMDALEVWLDAFAFGFVKWCWWGMMAIETDLLGLWRQFYSLGQAWGCDRFGTWWEFEQPGDLVVLASFL